MPIVGLLLAGVGRASVGEGLLGRAYVYPVCALLCAYVGLGATWWTLAFAGMAALTFFVGRTRWGDAPYMAVRFGLFPLLLTAFYVWRTGDVMAFGWPFACAVTGWMDGRIRVWAREHVWTWRGFTIDSARCAEFWDGCVIMGGLALL